MWKSSGGCSWNTWIPGSLAALVMMSSAPAGAVGQGIEGTYELRVCAMECAFDGPAEEVASGIVVLTRMIRDARAGASEPRRRAYERSWRYLEDESGGGINGCFSIRPPQAQPISFAGIIPQGYTAWRFTPESAELSFPLYYSPDASYEVTLVRAGRDWVGRGASISAVADLTGQTQRHEFVRIRRIGPPEVDRCFVPPDSPEGLRVRR